MAQRGFVVLDPATAEWQPLKHGGNAALLLTPEHQSRSTMRVSLVERDAGSAPGPYHLHQHCRTLYLVLQGNVVFGVAGEFHEAGPDQGVFIEAGVPHGVHALGGVGARLVCLFDTYAPDDFVAVEWLQWEPEARRRSDEKTGAGK